MKEIENEIDNNEETVDFKASYQKIYCLLVLFYFICFSMFIYRFFIQ